jgi:dihydroxyacid dehydratase/phosphogluconate dehydratase
MTASRPLRSNFEPGTNRWAMRRAQWIALGLTDDDMAKPKIAIVNTSSDLASCFSHLDGIVGPLKESIRAAGGIGFEIRTAAPSDAITSAGAAGQYILPSRDLIASDIEVAAEGALLDGMVCLSSCDKTTPAHLMAAGRLNIPTIVVACGYQPSGRYRGVVLSQDDRQTMPSSSAPSAATSMSLTIRSRLGRMYCPAAPALVIASLGAAVRISNPMPPASRMDSFSGPTMPSR